MGKAINPEKYKLYREYCERKKKAQLLNTTIPLRLKLLRNRLEQKMDQEMVEEIQQNKKRNQRRNKKKSPKKKQERDARNALI